MVSCEPGLEVEGGSPLGQVHPPMAVGATVLERVRALESKLPGLKEKLGPYTHPGDDARISTAASGEAASLTARVDALEDAVRVLVTAQVGPNVTPCFFFLSCGSVESPSYSSHTKLAHCCMALWVVCVSMCVSSSSGWDPRSL